MTVEGVIAQAEESEIVGQQPLQKLHRLGDLVDRQRRRIGFQLIDDAVDAVEHRPPVLHGQPHLAENALQRGGDRSAHRSIVDRIHMNVDEAFARIAGGVGRAETFKLAVVALHAEHRMHHQPHFEPTVGEFAHHRIDQERHVVVDDLEHRDRLAAGRSQQRHGLAADFRRAGRALGDKIPGLLGQPRHVLGRIAHDIFGHGAPEQLRQEIGRNFLAAGGQGCAGLTNRGAGGDLFLAGGKFNGQVR